MRRYRLPRAQLFLLELVIVLLFFTLAGSIVVQCLARAEEINGEAAALSGAVLAAQTAAEQDAARTSFEPSAYPRTEYYDAEWQPVAAADAVFELTVTAARLPSEVGQLAELTYQVSSGGREVYTLMTAKYYRGGDADAAIN